MTQEEKNKLILDQWDKESIAKEWIREHLKYNKVKEELEELQQRIDKAIEVVRLCNTKCSKEVIEILGDKENE